MDWTHLQQHNEADNNKIRFSFEASWAISIYWWYADYLFLNRMSECCNLSLFKFLFIASTYLSSLQNCSNFFHSYIIANLSLVPTKYPSRNHSIYWKNKERYVFYTHGKISSTGKWIIWKNRKTTDPPFKTYSPNWFSWLSDVKLFLINKKGEIVYCL